MMTCYLIHSIPFSNHMPLFILPSDEINTGEGALIWPSILSFEEVKITMVLSVDEKNSGIRGDHQSASSKTKVPIKNGTRTYRDRLTLGMMMKLLQGEDETHTISNL